MRRISIRSLMVFVVVSAVGLAALRNANELWAGTMPLVALAAMGAALLGAVILRGRERCWWAGFAFFCGGYLAIAVAPWLNDNFQPQLGTTQLLDHVQRRMHSAVLPTKADLAAAQVAREEALTEVANMHRLVRNANDPARASADRKLFLLDKRIAALTSTPTRDQFHRVGHSLFALLAGLAGGSVATRFHARRKLTEVGAGRRSVERPHDSAI